MSSLKRRPQLKVFSTCPQSRTVPAVEYARRVADVARWSEHFGFKGMLVYSDNGLCDPWLVSDIILRETQTLCPLVTVQPAYMHPYAAAKMIASSAFLQGRQISVNLTASGFKHDRRTLNDHASRGDRYQRMTEYALILKALLASPEPVTFEGLHYQVHRLRMTPALDAELALMILVSGNSAAGRQAAKKLGAIAVRTPLPADHEADLQRDSSLQFGMRVGIIARETTAEAWHIARQRFSAESPDQSADQLAAESIDSQWELPLLRTAPARGTEADDPYWLSPFENFKTVCPYLVGSYERVGEELARYIDAGYETFIMDIPASTDELQHIAIAFQEAVAFADPDPDVTFDGVLCL